ncbi:outer membrane protein assembly factor BamB family protein [Streptomyces guryensis]|uniref:outer membrane protein assembly factor BamB family protein n=1 Tax=Streptomyces guryensis TaxID=2886947 RepID=UPI0022B76FEA|nr:PQQ-binding-like beta-propeller repeat protein [Streptomyces guryensis]
MSANGPVPGSGPYGQQPPPPQQPPVPPQQGYQSPQGYGYPQQPPATPPGQPGYGYPQQPSATPPGQPGYGYPQQPVPPQYPMAPQPGYGHPQQYPGAPVPSARPRKKKTGLIVLLVVALVVLGGAGGAAWYVLANSATEPLWSVPTNAAWSLSEQEVDGTWFTDKSVIQTLSDGVKAYDRDTGKRLWATPLPGAGNQACLAPSVSDGGIGVVAYGASGAAGSHGKCDHVAAYDLNSGKELWHQGFKVKDEFNSGTKLAVARTGETLVITTDREQVALKAADGTRAWDVKKVVPSDCDTGTYTGGKNLVRTTSCVKGDAFTGKPWTEVSLVAPATGKAEWTKRFGEDEADIAISTSPLVISGDAKGVFALDEKTGERRGKFQGMADKYHVLPEEDGSPMQQVAGVGNILLMGTAKQGSTKGEAKTLVAYDLDSGKELWNAPASNTLEYIPLRGTGSKRLLAYVTDGANKPKLVEFNPKDGAMTTVVEYPEEVHTHMGGSERPFWHNGVLYVSSVGASVNGDSYALVALPTAAS